MYNITNKLTTPVMIAINIVLIITLYVIVNYTNVVNVNKVVLEQKPYQILKTATPKEVVIAVELIEDVVIDKKEAETVIPAAMVEDVFANVEVMIDYSNNVNISQVQKALDKRVAAFDKDIDNLELTLKNTIIGTLIMFFIGLFIYGYIVSLSLKRILLLPIDNLELRNDIKIRFLKNFDTKSFN